MLSPVCARGRLDSRLSRVLVRRRRRRWRVHNRTSVVIAAESFEERVRVNASGESTLKLNPQPRGPPPFILFHPRRPMSGAQHSLRIFALPLSKQGVTGITTGARRSRTVLNTYYHFVTTPPSEADQGSSSLISKATDRVTGMWTDWGKAAPGTWKVGILTFHPPPAYREGLTPRIDQGVQLRRTSDRQA